MSSIIGNYNTYGGAFLWHYVPHLLNPSAAFGESGSLIKIYNPNVSSYEFADLTFTKTFRFSRPTNANTSSGHTSSDAEF